MSNPRSRASDSGEQRIEVSREAAVELLRGAERIFIAYAHSDLKQARELRRRLVKLRGERDPASVFLDQDSLRPGDDVSPARVEEALRNSPLMVVLCGDNTTRGTEVMREIEIGVELRRAGNMQLLPILLRPHVRMPKPLDYHIQGIFLAHLFPSIRYVRRAVSGAIVTLLVVAVALALGFVDASRRREREHLTRLQEQVRAKLSLFRAEPRSPIDLSGREVLDEYLTAAESAEAHDTAREIADELKRYPGYASRRLLPHVGTTPIGVVCRSQSVVVAYSEALAIVDTRVHGTRTVPVSRGRFVDLRLGADRAVYAEREYEGFAQQPDEYDEAEAVRGNEREVVRLSANDETLEHVALSRRLVWRIGHDFDGDEHGPSWWELDESSMESPWPSHLAPEAIPRWEKQLERYYSPDGKGVEVAEIGRSANGQMVLYDVSIHLNHETGQVEDAYHVFAVLASPAGKFTEVTMRTFFAPGADALFIIDGTENDYPTSERPLFSPAAVDDKGETLVLGNQLRTRRDGDRAFSTVQSSFPPAEATEIWFTTAGHMVAFHDEAGSLRLVDATTGEATHTFLRPPTSDLVGWCATRDGATVAVLYRGSRGLHLWDLAAFGTDGWARPGSPNRGVRDGS